VCAKATIFDEMLPAEIEADNLEMEIVDLMIFISNNPIPQNYGKLFQPPPGRAAQGEEDVEEPVKLLASSTLVKYVGGIIQLFRNKFPDHEDFDGLGKHDSPEFWSRLHSQFGTAVTRFHHQIGSEYILADNDIQPIYSSNQYTPPPTQIQDYVSLIDLQYILKKLIKDAKPGGRGVVDDGPLQRRALIALTFMCVAWGGEVKFIDTNRFMYHPMLGCLDLVWTELKTTNRYSMPVFPNKSTYESDVFHCLGGWFLCEDGLHRSHNEQGFETFLFPSLHRIRNDSVTKKITSAIRGVLPNNLTQEMVKRYSAKSLRKGSITQLMMKPGLTVGDVCGRSGHSTGTNIDTYADKRNDCWDYEVVKLLQSGQMLMPLSMCQGLNAYSRMGVLPLR
jgi:hypothetical protein